MPNWIEDFGFWVRGVTHEVRRITEGFLFLLQEKTNFLLLSIPRRRKGKQQTNASLLCCANFSIDRFTAASATNIFVCSLFIVRGAQLPLMSTLMYLLMYCSHKYLRLSKYEKWNAIKLARILIDDVWLLLLLLLFVSFGVDCRRSTL